MVKLEEWSSCKQPHPLSVSCNNFHNSKPVWPSGCVPLRVPVAASNFSHSGSMFTILHLRTILQLRIWITMLECWSKNLDLDTSTFKYVAAPKGCTNLKSTADTITLIWLFERIGLKRCQFHRNNSNIRCRHSRQRHSFLLLQQSTRI